MHAHCDHHELRSCFDRRRVSIDEESTSVCLSGTHTPDEAVAWKIACNADGETEEFQAAKQESGCRTSKCPNKGCEKKNTHDGSRHGAEDTVMVDLKYPLPPTDIHDGRLFRKVG
jgi:hypothetical protein